MTVLSNLPVKCVLVPLWWLRWRTDDDGRHVLASRSFLSLLSLTFQLLQTRSWLRRVDVGDRCRIGRIGSGCAVKFNHLLVNVLLFLTDGSRQGVEHLQLWITGFHHERLQRAGRPARRSGWSRMDRPGRAGGGDVGNDD